MTTMVATEQKYIYLVISQTPSVIARTLKAITHAQYNHISLAFQRDIDTMYSFGRHYQYFPFYGGLVTESPHRGTMKRFENSNVTVMAIPLTSEVYDQLYAHVMAMYENRKQYKYNYMGIFWAWFKIARRKRDCYYCSEFIRELFIRYHIDGYDQLKPITEPIHFLNVPGERIYTGTLKDYAAKQRCNTV